MLPVLMHRGQGDKIDGMISSTVLILSVVCAFMRCLSSQACTGADARPGPQKNEELALAYTREVPISEIHQQLISIFSPIAGCTV